MATRRSKTAVAAAAPTVPVAGTAPPKTAKKQVTASTKAAVQEPKSNISGIVCFILLRFFFCFHLVTQVKEEWSAAVSIPSEGL